MTRRNFVFKLINIVIIVIALFYYNQMMGLAAELNEANEEIEKVVVMQKELELQRAQRAEEIEETEGLEEPKVSGEANDIEETPPEEESKYKEGVYEGTGQGYGGEVTVQVMVDSNDITDIEVTSANNEDAAYYNMAIAIIATYVERLLPSPVPPVPGIKLGIANVVILTVMYLVNAKSAFLVNVTRIVLVGLMFSGVYGMMYALAGGIFSFTAMYLAKSSKKLSIIGVSILGGIFHNIGQILIAMAALRTKELLYYLPVLLVSGIVTGVLVGYGAKYCNVALKRYRIKG